MKPLRLPPSRDAERRVDKINERERRAEKEIQRCIKERRKIYREDARKNAEIEPRPSIT